MSVLVTDTIGDVPGYGLYQHSFDRQIYDVKQYKLFALNAELFIYVK